METITNIKKEVVVNVPDEIGILSRISQILSDAEVGITAICGYETDGTAHLRLITEDDEKAMAALKSAGIKASEHDVLVSEISPHSLHTDLTEAAGGYEVENNYWCAANHSGEHALLVFSPREHMRMAGLR